MKKNSANLFFYLIISILMVGFTSCSDDEPEDDNYVWDFAPVTLNFKIVNSQGVNLIEEDAPLYGTDIKVIYKDRDFIASWDGRPIPVIESRTYFPILYGLFYVKGEGRESSVLRFGELNGEYCDAQVKLVLPDGLSHDITIYRDITTKGSKYFVTQKVTFDGKVIDSLTDGGCNMQFTVVVN